MVLAFTEAEKAQIESSGMMVIEFKRNLNHTCNHTCKGSSLALNEISKTVGILMEVIHVFCEKFDEAMEDLKLFIEEIKEEVGYSNSRRYKFVSILSKCTGIEKKSIWKMKRHMYLARSCC